MSCSCSKKLNSVSYKGIRIIDQNNDTLPFEVCPYCAFKHLAYAFIVAPKDQYQCIGELFLAYKHLQNNFKDISMKIIDLINLILSKKYNHVPLKFILKLEDEVHELAIKYKEANEDLPQSSSDEDLDEKISDKFTVYICGANELYNHELGYKDLNYKYVLGLLQLAIEYAPNEEKKNLTRSAWKIVESGEDIDLLDLLK